MFTTFFLKFDSEAHAIDVLSKYRKDGEWILSSADYALDLVGTIYKPTGNMLQSEDGFDYPETAPLDGWHVNMACNALSDDLVPYTVSPTSPSRIFA